MNDFFMNENLLYVVGSKNCCMSVYNNKKLEIKQNINKYIDCICKKNGSSLKGRLESSKYLLNGSYKNPIVISEKFNIIIFNINDANYEYWVNYKQIINIKKFKNDVVILFKCNQKLRISISKFKIDTQIMKCALLDKSLYSKIN